MPLPKNVTPVRVTPAPIRDVVLSQQRLGSTWVQWITELYTAVKAMVRNIASVSIEDHAASISATALPTPTIPQGLYQVSYAARITQAATTSSALTVTIDWVDGGVACSQSGAAMTGNATSTQQSGFLLIQADSESVVRYSTTYASTGAQPMLYQLAVRLAVAP